MARQFTVNVSYIPLSITADLQRKQMKQVPPKRCYPYTKQHGVIPREPQNTTYPYNGLAADMTSQTDITYDFVRDAKKN
jgi:hypothetical protein